MVISGASSSSRGSASIDSTTLEADIEKAELAPQEKSRATATALNAEIRWMKAKLTEEVPELQRLDKFALVGSFSEGTLKSVNVDAARRMALKHIETFVMNFSDPQVFSAASSSSTPASLAQVVEAARIQEVGHLRCSGAEIGRFVAMLRNSSSIL